MTQQFDITPNVLVLASDCNPEWPSLPVVGYKYALALADTCNVTVVTHIRNRENICKLHPAAGQSVCQTPNGSNIHFVFIDTEYIAAPLHKLSILLRGGNETAWSIGMIMAYPTYVEFERQTWKRFKKQLLSGEFDIIHRITPMSPTLPSYIAGRAPQKFVIGPLNGNLDWPTAFAAEQKRENERARILRQFYKLLPFSKRTYIKADAILAAFQHTINDLSPKLHNKIVMFPEVGYDATIFYPPKQRIAGPLRFLFAGRLVPYKLPEVAVRAFLASDKLGDSMLHIIGGGPEQVRLEALVEEAGATDKVIFEGHMTQAEVGQRMRETDVFVFPSIRELGAGVVVEAMACGMYNLVVDYGGPADLIDPSRGAKVAMADIKGLVASFQAEMEACLIQDLEPARQAAADYAKEHFLWDEKAAFTKALYANLLADQPLGAPYD